MELSLEGDIILAPHPLPLSLSLPRLPVMGQV